MKNKKLYVVVLLLFVLALIYLIPIILESKNIVKFITTYYLVEKSEEQLLDELNPCVFSEMTLKNNVEFKCKPLIKSDCNNKIPSVEKYINKDTACAEVTIDINGFNKKPNTLSSINKIKDQYQFLIYNNGVVTIPNSIEDEIMHSKKRTLKREIQRIILFFEIGKNIDTFKAVQNYKKQ